MLNDHRIAEFLTFIDLEFCTQS